MRHQLNFSCIGIIISIFFISTDNVISSQVLPEPDNEVSLKKYSQEKNLGNTNSGSYILGPGDSVLIDIEDIHEYSGIFNINADGTLYLPRLRSIIVEGKTINELRDELQEKYSEFIINPEIYVSSTRYRAVRVYVGGEVQRPGFYYLNLPQQASLESKAYFSLSKDLTEGPTKYINPVSSQLRGTAVGGPEIEMQPASLHFPTVFDALKRAGGVTPFSKLEDVKVTRKLPKSSGGRIKTSLDFLGLIMDGNESQNIRLFDGDNIYVSRSEVELREQIIQAGRSNLSPDFIQVYVTGRIKEPGAKVLPQGSTLRQALASAGGPKLLSGKVEFVRFNRDGSTDKRVIFSQQITSAKVGSSANPILMAGDIVRVNETILSATLGAASEFVAPTLGVYSFYSLFNQ